MEFGTKEYKKEVKKIDMMERYIRKFVGLRKVNGSFRSEKPRSPTWQTVIMSVIETTCVKKQNYFDLIIKRLTGGHATILSKHYKFSLNKI